MTRIDAHCHYWSIGRGDYGWLTPELEPIYRDFGAHDHDAVSASLGVTQRVLVQAAPTVAETHFLLTCAKNDAKATGVVGWVDLTDAGCVGALDHLAADPTFKGIRPMLQDIADPDWIMTAPHPEAIAALKRLGLRFDALAKPPQLDAVVRFVDAHPGLPVIVDHGAKPPLARPADDAGHALWAKGMAALASREHVCCKLSGLLTEMAPKDVTTPKETAARLKPTVGKLLEWFGPNRLAWGSDWPVLTLAASYGFWAEVTDIVLAGLSADERAAIDYGTAARFYGLEPRP